jgi:hypothetical protein
MCRSRQEFRQDKLDRSRSERRIAFEAGRAEFNGCLGHRAAWIVVGIFDNPGFPADFVTS